MSDVRVGVNALITSDYGDPDSANLEALVQVDDLAVFLWNDRTGWHSPGSICDGVLYPPAMTRSDRPYGGNHDNFEALIVRNDGELQHFWRDNSKADIPWNRWGTVVPAGVTGQPSLITSDLDQDWYSTTVTQVQNINHPTGEGSPNTITIVSTEEVETTRTLEALIPTTKGLFHWTRLGAPVNRPSEWQQQLRLTENPRAVGCLIQSDYKSRDDHGNLEALVFEPDPGGRPWGTITPFSYDGQWHSGMKLEVRALGPASLIQADYTGSVDHRNFEVLIEEFEKDTNRALVRHWWRDNSYVGLPWKPGVEIPMPYPATGLGVSMVQGNRGKDEDHGNFEALIATADSTDQILHVFREQANLQWDIAGPAYPVGP